MKLNVVNRIQGVGGDAVSITIDDPNATVAVLRAKCSTTLRLSPFGFSISAAKNTSGEGSNSVSADGAETIIEDEQQPLSTHFSDGATVVLLPKGGVKGQATTNAAAASSVAVGQKRPREQGGELVSGNDGVHSEDDGEEDDLLLDDAFDEEAEEPGNDDGDGNEKGASAEGQGALASATADDASKERTQINMGYVAAALIGVGSENTTDSEAKLYQQLLQKVPDILGLRAQFLSNPSSVLRRIKESDEELFQLISENSPAFLSLMNNEEQTQLLHMTKVNGEMSVVDGNGGVADGENFWGEMEDGEDEPDDDGLEMTAGAPLDGLDVAELGIDIGEDGEIDEESAMALLRGYLAGVMPGGNNYVSGDDEESEDEGEEFNFIDEEGEEGGATAEETAEEKKARILDFTPTEEDDQKIQQLVQLGFDYNQCKIAFYLSRRSLERAANLLFESPPQL